MLKDSKVLFWVFVCSIISCSGLFAQKAPKELKQEPKNKNSKHAVHLELLGRSFVVGSMNYEYVITTKWAIGGGLGFVSYQKGEITRNFQGVSETGRYFDTSTTQMIFANYLIGKRKHKLIITSGITNFLSTSRNKYPSDIERSFENSFHWNAGLGYQHEGNKLFYRITGYAIDLPQSDFIPTVAPWLGVTLGHYF